MSELVCEFIVNTLGNKYLSGKKYQLCEYINHEIFFSVQYTGRSALVLWQSGYSKGKTCVGDDIPIYSTVV